MPVHNLKIVKTQFSQAHWNEYTVYQQKLYKRSFHRRNEMSLEMIDYGSILSVILGDL